MVLTGSFLFIVSVHEKVEAIPLFDDAANSIQQRTRG
jgi:hypothetical protein